MKRKVEFAAHDRDRSGPVGHVLHECLLSDGREAARQSDDAVFEMRSSGRTVPRLFFPVPRADCGIVEESETFT
jgi:hypothetical protein